MIAHRAADQVGVGELLARPQLTVVEQDAYALLLEPPLELGGLLLEPGQRDDVDVVRRDRSRPRDTVLVVVLLDDGGHHPPGSDPVAAAEDRLLAAVLVEERRVERRRVERPEIEDVPDLDRRLEARALPPHPAQRSPSRGSRRSANSGS